MDRTNFAWKFILRARREKRRNRGVGWSVSHPWNRSAYIVLVGIDPVIRLPGFIGEGAGAALPYFYRSMEVAYP